MKEEDNGISFFSSKKKKCRERRELTFLLLLLHLGWSAPLAFSSPCSFNVELSTFLKPCVSCLLEIMCYSSLTTLLSSGVSKKCRELSWALEWAGNEVKEVGGGNFGAQKGLKNPCVGKMSFWFIPKMAWTASSWTGALVPAGPLHLTHFKKWLKNNK
jgi:hypothetical protein